MLSGCVSYTESYWTTTVRVVARSSLKGDGVCGATGSGRRREYLVRVLLAATSEIVLVLLSMMIISSRLMRELREAEFETGVQGMFRIVLPPGNRTQ